MPIVALESSVLNIPVYVQSMATNKTPMTFTQSGSQEFWRLSKTDLLAANFMTLYFPYLLMCALNEGGVFLII